MDLEADLVGQHTASVAHERRRQQTPRPLRDLDSGPLGIEGSYRQGRRGPAPHCRRSKPRSEGRALRRAGRWSRRHSDLGAREVREG